MYPGERLNGITHLAGLALAVAGSAYLLSLRGLADNPALVAGVGVFGLSSVLMYAASTLYHCTAGRLKAVWLRVDHGVIFVLIAGTYTPYALLVASTPAEVVLFVLVWVMAIFGAWREAARTVTDPPPLKAFLVFGWVTAVAALTAALQLGAGLEWLVAGACLYTAGTVFYRGAGNLRHAHGVWHLFVVGGNACHFVSVAEMVGSAG